MRRKVAAWDENAPPWSEGRSTCASSPTIGRSRWKNTAREGVARFALVEAGIGSPTQSGIADPAESEQGTPQAADFPERLGERVLSGILGPGVYAAHTLAHL